MTFLAAAWAWLKKYWKWLLFPVGALLYLAGRLFAPKKPEYKVISPESLEAEKTRQEADAEAAEAIRKAREVRDAEEAKIESEHLKRLRELTEEQEKDADRLSRDPKELNDYLKKVGKDIRG